MKINPNKTRDFIYTDLVSKRPHATWTPTKSEKLAKQARRQKQRGWE